MPVSCPHVMLIAGEPSGDLLGARLMAALRSETGGRVSFSGVGGDNMAGEGLHSLFPMEDLSVMGFAEIVPRLALLLRRIRETATAAVESTPTVLVTIDSPGFNLRVASRLKGKGIPLIHYVAPQVWAWRPGRARKIAQTLDHMLALLPFEPPFFESEGLSCEFVGHSVIEESLSEDDRIAQGKSFRAYHNIPQDVHLLTALPGSRRSEIDRLLPIFGKTIARLKSQLPKLEIVVPTLPQIETSVRRGVNKWITPAIVVVGTEDKRKAFAAADAALAASGTVSLELAAARVPTIIAYKVHPISAWIGRQLIKAPWFSLTNIILNREVVPELMQEDCRAELLAPEVYRLLVDAEARDAQTLGAEEALKQLGLGDEMLPSRRAARAILVSIGHRALDD